MGWRVFYFLISCLFFFSPVTFIFLSTLKMFDLISRVYFIKREMVSGKYSYKRNILGNINTFDWYFWNNRLLGSNQVFYLLPSTRNFFFLTAVCMRVVAWDFDALTYIWITICCSEIVCSYEWNVGS